MRGLAGIFVGGASTRMGGQPKGLLRLATGETLVDRWLRLFDALGIDAILVGARDAYAPRPMLVDSVEGVGPLGGLVALLEHGRARPWVVSVACDMPHVSPELVQKLIGAPPAVAVAPRREGRWEPMLARYEPQTALPVARARALGHAGSLQGLLDELQASPLELSADELPQLADWDTLDDIRHTPA